MSDTKDSLFSVPSLAGFKEDEENEKDAYSFLPWFLTTQSLLPDSESAVDRDIDYSAFLNQERKNRLHKSLLETERRRKVPNSYCTF